MNIAVVQQVASELRRQASRVAALQSHIDSSVAASQDYWEGADSTQFTASWRSDRTMLTQATNTLEALARKAIQEAAQQRRTSNNQ
jgi:uncharacterized protein YukE